MSSEKKSTTIVDDTDDTKLNDVIKSVFFNGRHATSPAIVQKQKFELYSNPGNDPRIAKLNKKLASMNRLN